MRRIVCALGIILLNACGKDSSVSSNQNEVEFYDARVLKDYNTSCGDMLKVNFDITTNWHQIKFVPTNLHDSFKTFPPAIPVKGKFRYLNDSFACQHDGSPSVVVGTGKYKYRKVELIWIERM